MAVDDQRDKRKSEKFGYRSRTFSSNHKADIVDRCHDIFNIITLYLSRYTRYLPRYLGRY